MWASGSGRRQEGTECPRPAVTGMCVGVEGMAGGWLPLSFKAAGPLSQDAWCPHRAAQPAWPCAPGDGLESFPRGATSAGLCAPHRSAPCPLHTCDLSHLRSMCPCMETLVLSAEPQVPIKAKQSVPHTLPATLAALGILGRSLLLSPFLPRVLVLFFSEPGGSTSPFKLNTLEMGSLVAQASLKLSGFEL